MTAASSRPEVSRRRAQARLYALLAAVLLGCWQLWAGSGRPANAFRLSYWFVTYDQGFVRRGLSGELNRWLFPGDLRAGAEFLCLACGAVTAVLLLLFALWLVTKGGDHAAIGWVMLASPFVVKAWLMYQRPDQLGLIPLLVLAVGVLTRRMRRGIWLVTGVVLAVATLIHEGSTLTFGPWIAFVILLGSRTTSWSVVAARLAQALGPAAALVGLLVTVGVPNQAQIAIMADASAEFLPGGNTVFVFIDNGVAASMASVRSLGAINLAALALLGVGVVAIHGIALVCAGVPRPRGVDRPKAASVVAVIVVIVGVTVQFATGFDWTRWFAYWTSAALISWAVLLMDDGPRAGSRGHRTGRMVIFTAALIVLIALPATNETNRLPCTFQAVVIDAPKPAARAWEALHGREMTPLAPRRCTSSGEQK